MENNKVTEIHVRRGINRFKYSACRKDGRFIGNLSKLGDARKHWLKEIQWGQVVATKGDNMGLRLKDDVEPEVLEAYER